MSTACLGRLKWSPRDRDETAQLHLSLDHLKRPWACAMGLLMALGNSFLFRDDAMLISHKKREAPLQGWWNWTTVRKRGEIYRRHSLPSSSSLAVTPLSTFITSTCVSPRRCFDPGGCYKRLVQLSSVQRSAGLTQVQAEEPWQWWQPPVPGTSRSACVCPHWTSTLLAALLIPSLEQRQLCSAQPFLEKRMQFEFILDAEIQLINNYASYSSMDQT